MKEKSKARKEHARDAFKECVHVYYQQPFGRLNSKQLSEGLTRFFIEEIHNRLASPISQDDFDIAYVDAAGDLGVDFIYRDNETVLILQTKYLAEGKPVSQAEIQHFQTIFNRITDARFKQNSKLADALSEIDIEHDRFILKFITLGDIVGQAKQQAELSPDLPEGLADRCEFQFFDSSLLTDELRNAKSLSAGIPGDSELVAAGKRGRRSPIIELEHEEFPSCVIVVEAPQLIQLYQRYRDALFTLNIRNYLGNTATNKLLMQTLKQEPGHFFYYNNGISCLAETIQVEGDRVIATGLQVINGAQTIRSLAKASKGLKGIASTKDVLLLVRITSAATQYGAEGRFRDQIVRFNNTQNTIKASDFRSNDPIHTDIKRRFSEHRWMGKKVVYVPKRTDPAAHRGDKTIPIEEYAKVVYSFMRDPVRFSSSTAFLFDDSESGGYKYVFGDGQEAWTTIPESEFRLRAAIWWLAEAFGDELKKEKKTATDSVIKAALERKWMILFVSRMVLERSYQGDEYKAELQKLYKGDWEFRKGSVGEWIAELYESSKEILLWNYREAMKKPGFVHRNWMRDTDTIRTLENFVQTAPIRMVRRQ